MSLLRSVLFLVYLVVTVIPWAIFALLFSVVRGGAPLYWVCAGWLKAAILGARWICGVRWRVQGMEHLPTAAEAQAAVILCPKHQSTWETFALPMLMPHPLAFVFKRELLRIPFFGWAMARLDMVHIDRTRRAEAWARVLKQGGELMQRGIWLIMFPEGTRVGRGERGEYKTGATRLAVQTGVPVVPVAVTSARCWPRKSFLLRPGVIDVSIGRPIPSVGRRHDELMAEVEGWIEAEMVRLDPQAYPAATATGTAPASQQA
ncbi:MAG: hypothetical protein RIQ53_3392 [Pseudomonadota bacterium]